MDFIIGQPAHVDLHESPSSQVFPFIRQATAWSDEQIIVAALYLGGLIYIHGFGWKRLRFVDTNDVAPIGMARHIWQIPEGHFYLSGLPKEQLVTVTLQLTDAFTEARGRVLVDGLIAHILSPFLGFTGNDGGGGEPILLEELLRKAS